MNNPLLLVIGLVFIVLGFVVSRFVKAKKSRCTASASGIVSDVRRQRSADDDGRYSYHPVYEYTANGQVIKREGNVYSKNRKKYQAGQPAQIMYNPEKPEEFYVVGAKKQVSFGFILIVVGVIFYISAFVS